MNVNPSHSWAERRAAIAHYIGLGLRVVPVPLLKKGPVIKGWPHLVVESDDIVTYFADPSNVGVVMGATSGNLIDLDLDCAEAIELAADFLPPTWTFGRCSRPRSHWLYLVPNGVESRTFVDVPDAGSKAATLLEIRAGLGAQHRLQTIFPPSVHPSGEFVEWSDDHDALESPRVVEGEELVNVASTLATAVLMLRHARREEFISWFNGGRAPTLGGRVALRAAEFWHGAPVAVSHVTHRTRTASATSDIEAAVAAYNRDHERQWPRASARCPVCGHNGCFGALPDIPTRWVCHSTGHPNVGVAGSGCWTGDALDVDAKLAGLTRLEQLVRGGYLSKSGGRR